MPLIQLAHGRSLAWGEGRTLVMGVVNVTPDSFSEGGRFADATAAVVHALQLADEGADVIDVGGESSRPGAVPVALDEERHRVLPVIERLAAERPDLLVSIDTTKPELAREALAAGAHLLNDIGGGRDPAMLEAVEAGGAGFVVMHMQGEPRTMQCDPAYGDVVAEVEAFLVERVAAAAARGVARDRLVVDPGIGFGKRLEHNLALLRAGRRLRAATGCPVLIGASRKSLVGELAGIERPADRDEASLAAHVAAVAHGADIVRTHAVALTVRGMRVADAMLRAGH